MKEYKFSKKYNLIILIPTILVISIFIFLTKGDAGTAQYYILGLGLSRLFVIPSQKLRFENGGITRLAPNGNVLDSIKLGDVTSVKYKFHRVIIEDSNGKSMKIWDNLLEKRKFFLKLHKKLSKKEIDMDESFIKLVEKL